MLSKTIGPRSHTLRAIRRPFSTQVTKLPNGLTVATQKTYDHHITTALLADAGTRDETVMGESRIFQRMAQKTASEKLGAEIEKMGANISVDVGKEQSKMVMTTLGSADNGKQAMGVLKQCAFGSEALFEEAKAEVEEGYDNDLISTYDLIMDRTCMSVFRDCSLGHTSYPEDTSNMTKASMKNFVSNNFVGPRLVVSAVGNVDHAEVVKNAEANFGSIAKQSPTPVNVPHKPYFVGAMMNYRNDEMGQFVYFTLSFQTVSWRSPQAVTGMLIAEMLGEYQKHDPQSILPGVLSGNRLVNNSANRMNGYGCIEYHLAQQQFFRDTGIFTVYCVCDEVALQDARMEIQFYLNMLSGQIMDEEVERAKKDLKLRLFSTQFAGSTEQKATTLGQHLLSYGRFVSPEELCHRIDDLSSADIKSFAYEFFHDNEIAVTALGPTHSMKPLPEIRMETMPRRF